MSALSLLTRGIGGITHLARARNNPKQAVPVQYSLAYLESIARNCRDMFELRGLRQNYLKGLRANGRGQEADSLSYLARESVLGNLIEDARETADNPIADLFNPYTVAEKREIVLGYHRKALRLARKIGVDEAQINYEFRQIMGMVEEG